MSTFSATTVRDDLASLRSTAAEPSGHDPNVAEYTGARHGTVFREGRYRLCARRGVPRRAKRATDISLFRRLSSRVVSDFKYDWMLREVCFRQTGRFFRSNAPTGSLRYGRSRGRDLRPGDPCEIRRKVDAAGLRLVRGEQVEMGPWQNAIFQKRVDETFVVSVGETTVVVDEEANVRGRGVASSTPKADAVASSKLRRTVAILMEYLDLRVQLLRRNGSANDSDTLRTRYRLAFTYNPPRAIYGGLQEAWVCPACEKTARTSTCCPRGARRHSHGRTFVLLAESDLPDVVLRCISTVSYTHLTLPTKA